MAKKSKKGESSRTETLTVRFTPMLKYGAELLARKHHRTLAGAVEWAVEHAISGPGGAMWLGTKKLNPEAFGFDELTPEFEMPEYIELLPYLWDIEEVGRLHRLAIRAPELMTFEEQKLWELIKGNGYYWKLVFISDTEKGFLAKEMNLTQDVPVYRWEELVLQNLLIDRVNKDLLTLKELVTSNKSPADALSIWIPLVHTECGTVHFTDKITPELEVLVKDQIAYPPIIEMQEKKKKKKAAMIAEIEKALDQHPEKRELLDKIERYADL